MPTLSSAKQNRQFMGGLRQNDRLNALLEGNMNQDLEQRKRDRSINQGGLSLVQLIGNKNPRSISQDLRAKHTATPPDQQELASIDSCNALGNSRYAEHAYE